MQAIITTKYGAPEVLEMRDVARPEPKDNEILVKNFATAVSSGDVHLRKADPFVVRLFFGLMKPKIEIFGFVFAGEVEAIGKDVTRFSEGDLVYGTTGMTMGAYAQYVCVAEDIVVAAKPGNLSFEEAASVPFGGNTALHFLRKARVGKGQNVLIYGASGAVGTAAVQIAKAMGANVTGVCSTTNLELVTGLGADQVIDYTREDFTENGQSYDVIFDTVGKSDYARSLKSLRSGGVYALAAAGFGTMLRGALRLGRSTKVVSGVMHETQEDLIYMNGLLETGALKPVIDRAYPLAQISQAHAYAEKGHKKGNVVIAIGHDQHA